MKHISLFAGIGGFDLASEEMGWQNIASCEINSFGNKVLNHYWPNAYHHEDIKTFTYQKLDEELTKRFGEKWRTDDIVLTGGFPCQPYSVAGKQLGTEDERHLWPEMLRAIREIQPTYVVGENVRGLINWNGGMVFEQVQTDLETEGYEVIAFVLPACGVNAPHRRDRVWFVAYSSSFRNQRHRHKLGEFSKLRQGWAYNEKIGHDEKEGLLVTPNPYSGRQPCKEHGQEDAGWIAEKGVSDNWANFPTQSPIRGGNDGIPEGLVNITFPKWRNESIKAFGNAIVPAVALQIFKSIQNHKDEQAQL